MKLAAHLRKTRAASGKSLREVGEAVGASHVTIREIETGELIPSRGLLRRLAAYYEIPVDLEAMALEAVRDRATARWMLDDDGRGAALRRRVRRSVDFSG